MKFRNAICMTALSVISLLSNGCTNQQKSVWTGAAIGAGAGAAIGGSRGKAGQGAAIGAIVGGVGGAMAYNRNNRHPGQNQRHALRNGTVKPRHSRSLATSRSSNSRQSLWQKATGNARLPTFNDISRERADQLLDAMQPQRGPVDGSYLTGMPFANFW